MAVRIRLRRIGKNPKNKPHFRISVFDERTTRDGKFIEEIGFYNPVSKQARVDKARYEHWRKMGALPTLAVVRVMKKAEMVVTKELTNAAADNAS
ncbi:MAG TPA: 30S ribosomal protein S16 [Candidatus Omnitrophota bacterium]|nr:30S ribosomal protein S16 [Candidatus Omnitrophota bacterium]HRZ15690.1 30S ribosomal protein S16 [Candidatus Omnitrophota bacterium]